eukprot:COSAG01_NODE_1368_length_10555_cov_25.123757_6_plen_297_part_00
MTDAQTTLVSESSDSDDLELDSSSDDDGVPLTYAAAAAAAAVPPPPAPAPAQEPTRRRDDARSLRDDFERARLIFTNYDGDDFRPSAVALAYDAVVGCIADAEEEELALTAVELLREVLDDAGLNLQHAIRGRLVQLLPALLRRMAFTKSGRALEEALGETGVESTPTVRKEAAALMDCLFNDVPWLDLQVLLGHLLPLIEAAMDGEQWQLAESAILALGAISNESMHGSCRSRCDCQGWSQDKVTPDAVSPSPPPLPPQCMFSMRRRLASDVVLSVWHPSPRGMGGWPAACPPRP